MHSLQPTDSYLPQLALFRNSERVGFDIVLFSDTIRNFGHKNKNSDVFELSISGIFSPSLVSGRGKERPETVFNFSKWRLFHISVSSQWRLASLSSTLTITGALLESSESTPAFQLSVSMVSGVEELLPAGEATA